MIIHSITYDDELVVQYMIQYDVCWWWGHTAKQGIYSSSKGSPSGELGGVRNIISAMNPPPTARSVFQAACAEIAHSWDKSTETHLGPYKGSLFDIYFMLYKSFLVIVCGLHEPGLLLILFSW